VRGRVRLARSGNWLSAEESSEVLKCARENSMRAKRDYAMLALLFGCGFHRSELVGLELDEIQMRQGHWALVDLIGNTLHPLQAGERTYQNEVSETDPIVIGLEKGETKQPDEISGTRPS
jgi:integrase